jgi:dCMP deaminase
MRPSKDQWAMDLALLTAKRSTCLRRQVGCILTDVRGHVLATGYNGVAAGMPHCNQETGREPAPTHLKIDPALRFPIYANACLAASAASGTNLDGCEAIHAEQNALLQCRDVHAIHTCYVTASPCMTCTKLLLNTGCTRIVFAEEYPQPEAGRLWKKGHRQWIHQSELHPHDD